jgi:hypothetical protein
MKLINKNTKEIKQHRKYVRFAPFISFLGSEKNVHFPVSTIEIAQLRIGSFIHFVEIGPKHFGFICNNDNSGFQLFANSKRDPALRIGCAAFVSLFKEAMGLKKGRVSYFIQKTNHELNGCLLFEILTHKSREQLAKDAANAK